MYLSTDHLCADAVDSFFSSYISKKFTIIIDAGHGGKDPGAIGKKGSYEKNVVLSIAQRLEKMLSKHPRFSCIMTRSDDSYVTLGRRQAIARIYKPAVFISIHSDSAARRSVRGATVFVLSDSAGNDSIARHLAKQYRSQHRSQKNVDEIISDLKFDHAIDKSEKIAHIILDNMNKRLKTLDRGIKRAPFAVLKNFSIPSILIEVGFISNEYDEKLLNTASYQNKIAECILAGLKEYLL